MSVTRRSILRGLAAIPAVVVLPAGAATTVTLGKGKFIGTVVAQWDDDGRDMTLTQPFEFIAPDGQRWPVPAGAQVNGASIPKVFWSVIGGPFEGRYRNASVVHDYYCGTQSRPYQKVHQVFYDAMMASGVDRNTAWLMFQAVNRFGPRWVDIAPGGGGGCNVGGQGDAAPCTRGLSPRSAEPAPAPAAKPKAAKKVGKEDLEAFLTQVQGKANPKDVAKLRKEIDKLQQ